MKDSIKVFESSNLYKSLLFYIDTAEKTEFSLEGLSLEDLKLCTSYESAADTRRELNTRFITLWELNRILFSGVIEKTNWHIRGHHSVTEIKNALGGIVPKNRIHQQYVYSETGAFPLTCFV